MSIASPSPSEFENIEVLTFTDEISLVSDANGEDFVEGIVLVDYDEVVDRNESLVLLQAFHHLVTVDEGQSGSDIFQYRAEISASPAISDPTAPQTAGAGPQFEDSIDIVGRPLSATGTPASFGENHGAFFGSDDVVINDLPRELAEFHPRDELFLNASLETDAEDLAVTATIMCQHFYGVVPAREPTR